MRWAIIFTISCALLVGCTSKVEKAKEEISPEKVVSRDEAFGSLPCFKCHSYQKFSATPQKGVFSHQIHINTGFHCNQCHDFQGHQHITVNRDVCSSCHNIKTISLNKTAFPSRFNHEGHTKMFGCKECHPGIFLMKAGTAQIAMKDINNGAYCGACHNGKKAFSAAECTRCHEMKRFDKELVYKSGGMSKAVFSHKLHTAAFSCSDCHPKLFAMQKTEGRMPMDSMSQGKFCGSCHNGNIAFPVSDCGKCHKD